MSGTLGDRAPHRSGITVTELARELPSSTEIVGDGTVRLTGIRHDSRKVRPGDLFVARSGRNVDGAQFVADAVARGASAVMTNRDSVAAGHFAVPLLLVDDPAIALAFAASAVYGHPSLSLDVVGITGTNGKTTTAHLVRAAIDGVLQTPSCGLLGTVEQSFLSWRTDVEHTTPEADDIARAMMNMRERGATYVAMEVSSHALDLGRVGAVRFRAAALTNLTQDHLDFHRSLRAYAEAKARLFTELRPESVVLNVDDALGRDLLTRVKANAVRVSALVGADADIVPLRVKCDASGIETAVRTPHGEVHIRSPLLGAHNLDNLLLTLGIVHALHLDLSKASEALGRAPAVPGRLERCGSWNDDVAVLVDYAHTPDALARTLDAVRALAGAKRVLCVFGCGGDRDSSKRALMGQAVAHRANIAIVTSDNPRTEDPKAIADSVAGGVRAGGGQPIVELDRGKAIALAVHMALEGDFVLLAGKGHEDYQIVGTEKKPFSDRIEAARALEARSRTRGLV
jgi:UDP-N-acetylmuramoyl-L-alanyl-D-glutamate--2,6-diaminopimelate ligase